MAQEVEGEVTVEEMVESTEERPEEFSKDNIDLVPSHLIQSTKEEPL